MLTITTTDKQVKINDNGTKSGRKKGSIGYYVYPNNVKLTNYPENSYTYVPWGGLEINGTIATPQNIAELMEDITGNRAAGRGQTTIPDQPRCCRSASGIGYNRVTPNFSGMVAPPVAKLVCEYY